MGWLGKTRNQLGLDRFGHVGAAAAASAAVEFRRGFQPT
jgi:hypothetical protein